MQTAYQNLPMRAKDDPLVPAQQRLGRAIEAAVTGRERAWAEAMNDALGEVERALRQHPALAQNMGGASAQIDRTRPSLARQAQKLNEEQKELLQRVMDLRGKAQAAARIFGSDVNPSQPAGAANGTDSIPDFGTIQHLAEECQAGLQRILDAEAGLVLESVNTDIGAGD
jgi:ABC-type transporter Mla subunit MlaD